MKKEEKIKILQDLKRQFFDSNDYEKMMDLRDLIISGVLECPFDAQREETFLKQLVFWKGDINTYIYNVKTNFDLSVNRGRTELAINGIIKTVEFSLSDF